MHKLTMYRIQLSLIGLLASVAVSADLILSAPPRESKEAGVKTYGPLAELLSSATGEKIEYRHPANWGLYQGAMTKGEYDLVFDGPHFVSWRIQHLKHEPLAALAGTLEFVILARKDDTHTHKTGDLAGRRVCGHAPPNLATLTLFGQFSPSRQPLLVETKGFKAAYEGLLAKKCNGTIVPLEGYRKLDPTEAATRVLYRSTGMTNQALTAGPRVSAELRQKITAVLVNVQMLPESRPIANNLGSNAFVAVTKGDYAGYDELLKNTWGFEAHP